MSAGRSKRENERANASNGRNGDGGDDVVLCINCGSSSLKFALFLAPEGGAPEPLATGVIDRIGSIGDGGDLGTASITIPKGDATIVGARENRLTSPNARRGAYPNHASALTTAFELLEEAGAPEPTVVGHRVVHGGARYVEATVVDANVIAGLNELVPMAPLHMPAAIAGIESVASRHPGLPQVVCFDTAFHASLPDVSRRIPIPDRFYEAGIRRYGFHGLSYEYILSTLRPPSRVIIAHLGNGSSLVAVKDGRAIDTTMGFTPTGGVMMGTRCGDIDPGVLLYLLRENGLSAEELDELVNRESGLAAIAGTSDMKTLVERAPDDERAHAAIAMYGYGIRKAIGAFTAALGGVDLLVFTGGIGENAAAIRAEACTGLEALGIPIDPRRNARHADTISAASSPCAVRVIPTNEDLVVARHACRLARTARRRI